MNFTLGRWFQRVRNPYLFFTKGVTKYISLGLALVLGLTISFSLFTEPAPAIDELKLIYGPANISLGIEDLQSFAQTGERSGQLNSLISLAKLSPEQVQQFRQALNLSIAFPQNTVNNLLGSAYGRLLVGAFNQFISPGSTVDVAVDDVIGAVRTAASDGQVSVLELILSYQGVEAVTVNVEDLINLYGDVANLGEEAITFLKAQPRVQQLVCK